jgi:integrase
MDSAVIMENNEQRRKKLIRYQTLISCGGYLGSRPQELLNKRWIDIIEKTSISQFSDNDTLKFNYDSLFIKYINKNYKRISPDTKFDLVLHKVDNPNESINLNQFNNALKMYFKRFSIETDNASATVLRKTFLYKQWLKLGGNQRSTCQIANYMGYKDVYQAMIYLGINEVAARFSA